MFNEFQKTVIAHYAKGACFDLATMEEVVEEAGDTLLTFLMREMGDCDSEFEAERRMEIAMEQLDDVYAAFGRGNIHEN